MQTYSQLLIRRGSDHGSDRNRHQERPCPHHDCQRSSQFVDFLIEPASAMVSCFLFLLQAHFYTLAQS